MRDLSRGLGVGVASSSRIHDAFTKPRLPAWGLLQLLVVELAGRAPDIEPEDEMKRFHRLWDTVAEEAEARAAGDEEPPPLHEVHVSRAPAPRARWAKISRRPEPGQVTGHSLPPEIKRVLVDTLAELYRTQNQAEELLEDMDFPPQTRPRWDATQDIVTYWRQVVRALELGAVQRGGVRQLLETMLRRWPGNQELHKIREFLGEERQQPGGAAGNADTLYRTVEFVGSEEYPELLRLVRELVDADAVQLYADHRQAAYRVTEMPAHRLDRLRERAAHIAPGVEVLYGEYDFRPALYTRLEVMGPDGQQFEIPYVPNTTLPSELVPAVWAQYRTEAAQDANGHLLHTVVDYRDESGEAHRLDPERPLYNQGVRDGGQLGVTTA
ncbi:effector-associated domain EAD1-containing protein [Streptomyces alanosinicus]|uniref:effector-associated domain EAD1-containing protein n=1 Tax=Streptomyces alanosinicus TaxID=68171 RepID=UPI001671BFD4|nr:effector-associated domain EAD1-containing protein [Streptomyces alanosinicus]